MTRRCNFDDTINGCSVLRAHHLLDGCALHPAAFDFVVEVSVRLRLGSWTVRRVEKVARGIKREYIWGSLRYSPVFRLLYGSDVILESIFSESSPKQGLLGVIFRVASCSASHMAAGATFTRAPAPTPTHSECGPTLPLTPTLPSSEVEPSVTRPCNSADNQWLLGAAGQSPARRLRAAPSSL